MSGWRFLKTAKIFTESEEDIDNLNNNKILFVALVVSSSGKTRKSLTSKVI